MRHRFGVVLVTAITSLACMGLATGPDAAGTQLRPESDLTRACHDWPEKPWTKKRRASLQAGLAVGQPAIAFTLDTPDGRAVTLSDLLQDGPVVVVAGSTTCDRYQETAPQLGALAEALEDEVTVVVVYTVEAHPRTDPSAYKGKPNPRAYSDREEPRSWKERARSAAGLDLSDDVIVLVDDLDGDQSNPFWCTYGTCANCGYLIDQDGIVQAAHLWLDPGTMASSIHSLPD